MAADHVAVVVTMHAQQLVVHRAAEDQAIRRGFQGYRADHCEAVGVVFEAAQRVVDVHVDSALRME
ncbi:hypothetical protein D3C79_656130 [compost metagenome]